jgi:predicted nucleic acid-binding Zn ribbon protein
MRRRDETLEDPDEGGDEDADVSDRDAPLEADVDDSDDDHEGDNSAACPYCGKPVYDGTEICPHCRNFISFEDAPRRHPWWIWVGVLLALAGMLWWVL